jgi:hypothetical protein
MLAVCINYSLISLSYSIYKVSNAIIILNRGNDCYFELAILNLS